MNSNQGIFHKMFSLSLSAGPFQLLSNVAGEIFSLSLSNGPFQMFKYLACPFKMVPFKCCPFQMLALSNTFCAKRHAVSWQEEESS